MSPLTRSVITALVVLCVGLLLLLVGHAIVRMIFG